MVSRWGSGALHTLADAMVGQESAGAAGGLLLRLARFLGGDPVAPILVTSTGLADTHGLPDNTAAMSAVVQVSGAGIIYRVDGQDPATAGGVSVVAGSTLTLTGPPTIRAFRFASSAALNSTLTGNYFD